MTRAEEEAVAAFSDWDARDARQLAEDRARLADATDARFTAAQREQLEAFEGADEPAEVAEARVVEQVARAIGDVIADDTESVLGAVDWDQCRRLAVAAIAAMPASPAEEAVRRVEAVAAELDERGDIEHADWRQSGQSQALGRRDAYETSAELIRAALAPQAGEAGR